MRNSFKELVEQMEKAETILLFPHVNADGDAIGSSVALCKALRKIGKRAYILVKEEIPENLRFMTERNSFLEIARTDSSSEDEYLTRDENIFGEKIDLTVLVDCGEPGRIPKRKETFQRGKVKLCIDHHRTSQAAFDFNYIDPEAAATGEIVFFLLKEMGFGDTGERSKGPLGYDKEIGEAIFAAITTDTGNFQYSNTNKNCHLIMSELYDWGIEADKVSVALYENVRPEKVRLENEALKTYQLLGSGKYKGALAYISLADMVKVKGSPSETDDIVGILRSIKDVEYAVFLKEVEKNVIRVSYRAKTIGNVSSLAQKYGGGGHLKAAGATLYMPLDEAINEIKKQIEEALNLL